MTAEAPEQLPDVRRRPPWLRAFQLFSLALVLGLLALLGWRIASKDSGSRLVSAIRADRKPQAPNFRLKVIWPRTETWPIPLRTAVADSEVSLLELRGYPVVLNFWASWCIPCKAEAPRFAAAARANAGEVAFLGIDIQDFTSDALRFLRRYEASYVSVRDGGDATSSAYGLTGVPETYYLDRRARIVAHSLGEVSERELGGGVALARGEAR